ncbi:MAG: NUDIX hydrolase [Acidobacteriota bacterium]
MSNRLDFTDDFEPQHWETLEHGDELERGVFRLQQIVRRSPRTGRAATYQVLRIRDWANVVALTPQEEVVLVAQYRHGLDKVTLEIPGGVLEPGEDPAHCAARELAEETGYTGEEPVLLGSVHPNPAIQDNLCTTWLIQGAELTVEPNPDEGEDIRVVTVPLTQIPSLLRQGRITHSLVVAAFHWLELAGMGSLAAPEML